MEKMTYESPKFEFEELKLAERVADTCWGYAYAWYDADKDGSIDGDEKVNLDELGLGSSGCQGNGAREALKEYFLGKFGVNLSNEDVSTNTKSQIVIGSNS